MPRTPRPPQWTGREACNHALSSRLIFWQGSALYLVECPTVETSQPGDERMRHPHSPLGNGEAVSVKVESFVSWQELHSFSQADESIAMTINHWRKSTTNKRGTRSVAWLGGGSLNVHPKEFHCWRELSARQIFSHFVSLRDRPIFATSVWKCHLGQIM